MTKKSLKFKAKALIKIIRGGGHNIEKCHMKIIVAKKKNTETNTSNVLVKNQIKYINLESIKKNFLVFKLHLKRPINQANFFFERTLNN